MNLIQKIKLKKESVKSFEENELKEMGSGK